MGGQGERAEATVEQLQCIKEEIRSWSWRVSGSDRRASHTNALYLAIKLKTQ